MALRCAVTALCVLVLTPAGALARTEIVKSGFVVQYSGPAPYCSFGVDTTFRTEHRLSAHFDLPTGVSVDEPEAMLHQISGRHFAEFTETVSNPANGLSLDLRGTVRLERRDIDSSGLTINDGLLNGVDRAIDYLSWSITATAPGEGSVVRIAGHDRYRHSSHYVDGQRVAREDVRFFHAGPFKDELCSHLAGG